MHGRLYQKYTGIIVGTRSTETMLKSFNKDCTNFTECLVAVIISQQTQSKTIDLLTH